jgi:glycosyltransferase involved in cell wall biosynthesis
VVITNVSKDNRIGGPAAKRLGIPVLQHVGGPGDITDRFRVRWEQKRYVTRVLVPAESVREQLSGFPWMKAESRVTVINNSVDMERFRPGPGAGILRSELGVDETTPLLVTTGQLTDIKGHDHLLSSFAALTAREPRPRLALIGRGPEEERLRGIARDLGVADRVHFMGFRRDLELLLEDADIVVQPSLMEGFPISVVEFMAKGKAIVASSLQGMEEAVVDEEHALLVPPADVKALTLALDRLLDDLPLRESLGQAARRRAEAEFGLQRMVDRVEALLEDMVG